jgi:hypothetical protein
MALIQKSFYDSDTAGTTEVLSLVPTAAGTTPFLVKIAGASYGNDTTDVTVSSDQLSVTLKVNSGMDSLVVTVISPNATDEALLVQGNSTLARFALTDHWDGCTLYVNGT